MHNGENRGEKSKCDTDQSPITFPALLHPEQIVPELHNTVFNAMLHERCISMGTLRRNIERMMVFADKKNKTKLPRLRIVGVYGIELLCERCFVPVEEALDAFVYLYLMVPAERVELADIDELAHCAVRLA